MEIKYTGALSAKEQMQIDCELINTLHEIDEPILRFYQWQKKSITYGHFIQPERYLDLEKAENLGFDIAKRPTGGGLIFHYGDFAFTFAVPSSHKLYALSVLASYRHINAALLASELCEIEEVPYKDLCMASISKYDLVWQGKKIAGSAQRRTKVGFVHQSSLFLNLPDWQEIEQIWLGSKDEFLKMKANTAAFTVNRSDLEARLTTRLGVVV